MPTKDPTTQQTKPAAQKGELAKPVAQAPVVSSENEQAVSLRRASLNPGRMTPGDILALQGMAGNRAVSGLLNQAHGAPPIQAKLTVGAAKDPYEQEADRVADRVLRMPEPVAQREAAPEEDEELQGLPALQREAAPEEDEELQGLPALQREAAPDPSGRFEVGQGIEDQIHASKGGGAPLPGEVRAFMEPRFGADFSGVRVHSGREAADLNRQVGAQAFTTGKDIYLGEGVSDLNSSSGKHLLAHELTHTIQQGGVSLERTVQRHPPGAELLTNAPAAVENVKNAGEDGSTAEPAGEQAPVQTGEEGKQGAKPAEEPTGPAPAPVLTGTMDIAFAQKAIQDTFKDVAPQPIITGQVTVVNGIDALYAVYDDICVKGKVLNKDTGKKWKKGDQKKYNDKRGLRTNAFAYQGKVWVDSTGADPTATVHEMLHVNTAANFLTKTGRIINEGMTQRLAVKAVLAKGSSVTGSESTYQQEQRVVGLLADIVGEDKLTHAYFNGADELIKAYDAQKGKDAFATLKVEIDKEDYTKINEILLVATDAAQKKLDEITELLKGWVSDKDLARIKGVYDSGSGLEKKYIRQVIEPKTHESFWREKTRTKVREIIAA